ncbi:MAG: NAD(P)/FAD-dependent oxidoreductase [Gemmatimonadota bacterium]|nr:NAD(P)/FAD-dependent oxidoreductase [Gemmatimonadota bacterium]
MEQNRPRVVILGAGFGGLWTARALKRASVDVTLIDRNNFHTFLPLLYQVGAAELEPFAIARPVRTILRGQKNARFVQATVLGIDLASKLVRCDRGVHGYDYLVVALGTVAYDFGVPGVREHAFPLKTLEDGITLRSSVLAKFERASGESDAARRHATLGFLVIGGGPTGVEYAGALAELIRGPMAEDYPDVVDDASITLIEASDRLLGAMPERLSAYALRRLDRMGVATRVGSTVRRVTPEGVMVQTTGGEEELVVGNTVAWTGGVRGAPEIAGSGLPLTADGRIDVGPTLQVDRHPEVFVVGDLVRLADTDRQLPQLCQPAMQGGEHAARAILSLERGSAPARFRYRDKGIMAVIGRNAAAASVAGRSFTGFFAWCLWLGIHIAYLIGFRNRFAVLLNWAWDYLFFERSARILIPLRVRAPLWPDRPGD